MNRRGCSSEASSISSSSSRSRSTLIAVSSESVPDCRRRRRAGDVLQARGQGRDRRSHAPVESDQQKPPLSAGKGIQGGFQKIFGHVVVERSFRLAHRVFVQPAAPLRERPVKKFLRLAAQGPR